MGEQLSVGKAGPAGEFDVTRAFGVGAAANGAVDTAVLRFTAANITNAAGAFTVAEDGNTGTILTNVLSGYWCIRLYAALVGAGNLQIGIGVNAAALGAFTNPPITFASVDAGAGTMGIQALAGDTNIAADGPHLLWCLIYVRLAPLDTIRFYATVAVTTNADNTRFFCDPIWLD